VATSVAGPSLLEIARSLAPLIQEHAEQGERERTIPPALVDALYERGVFRTFLPRELGGLEVGPVEWLDMVEELSRLDASVGWLAIINAGGTRLRPDVMRAILAEKGRWISASNLARTGIARRVDGGYCVSGRWPFASGCPHSLFMSAQMVLHDDAGEVVRHPDDGMPWVISATWPIEPGQILDTWDGLGLRGTGSHDIAVEDLFVPEAYTNDRPRAPVYPGPLYKGSFLFMAHAAHAVGIARRAIDAFVELCGRPAAPGSRRQSSLGKTQMQQVAVAKADALVRAARAFAWEATAQAYAAAVSDGEIPLDLRVRMGQSMIFAVQAGKQAVDLVYEAAGASAVYRGTTLERCFRDIHTAAQHIIVTENRYDSIGQYELTKDHPGGPAIESVFPF
jgi:alkylation response protein AidB-like acyl-CoA dehydrogenase